MTSLLLWVSQLRLRYHINFCQYCRYQYINLQVLASASADTDTTDVRSYWSIKLTAKVNFTNKSKYKTVLVIKIQLLYIFGANPTLA